MRNQRLARVRGQHRSLREFLSFLSAGKRCESVNLSHSWRERSGPLRITVPSKPLFLVDHSKDKFPLLTFKLGYLARRVKDMTTFQTFLGALVDL